MGNEERQRWHVAQGVSEIFDKFNLRTVRDETTSLTPAPPF
jgi:hypothetical protein